MPGIEPILLDQDAHPLRGPGQGRLCILNLGQGWHEQFGGTARYVSTYFTTIPVITSPATV